jgi:hypothetical protein
MDARADESAHGRVIRLVERVHDLTFQDNEPAGPSVGDRLIFSSDLFDEFGRAVGRDGADCAVVRIDPAASPANQQIVQCTITVQLAEGEITVQGLAQGTDNTFAITGGTGAFRMSRGEAEAKDIVPLQVADITITLSN